MKSPTKNGGFTLIELMVVVIIIAILLTIAVPGFDSLIKRNNVEALQTKLASAMATARSEAASRNVVTTICASTDGATCSGGTNWNSGWMVFEDPDNDGTYDNDEVVIDVYQHSSDYSFTSSAETGGAQTRLSFSSQGFLQSGNPSLFTICEPDGNETYARGIFVNASGLMIKTQDGADDDAIHDNPLPGEDDLACP